MTHTMIYPDSFEEKTGFATVRMRLSALCISEAGRAHVQAMSFLAMPDEVSLRLEQTGEFRRILVYGDEFPLGHMADATPWLRKLHVEGTFLELSELFDLLRSLETARMIVNYFRGRNAENYPLLAALAAGSPVPPFVRDRLSSLLTKEGRMKDSASPGLLSLRKDLAGKQAAVSKKLHSVLKEAQIDGIAESSATIAIRNGRPVIPVSASLKRKIPGFVHDESASGRTAYIEPAAVVELNNEIRELEYAERREILRILKEVAVSLRPYLQELFDVFRFLGQIDFIRAKALFAVKIGAIMPVLHDKPLIEWKNAVHPLLFLALKKEGRETVPLDISLDGENRILVISGPNAGGKSVCLKTVGLLQYMLQCGMLVPMSENSETGLFDGIFIDIGDEQSIENDLSTYSSHLMNMKFFVRNCSGRTLVLIDEFGTGTEPMLGGAIAESILDRLNSHGTFGVITTHYTNLKHFAASTKGIRNGAMLFDTGRMEPLFRLEAGKPGSSFAFEIARKIGLPEEILKDAAGKIGEEHIDFDRHLKEIIRDKHYWERKRRNIRQVEKKLEQDLERYGSELETAERERRRIISQAKEEAKALLESVNKRIENTIREIKEAQAEREKTKAARERLEELRATVAEESDKAGEVARKMERIREKKEKISRRRQKEQGEQAAAEKAPGVTAEEEDMTIRKGDLVRLFGRDVAGEVLDVTGKSIMVAFGSMITTVKESKLEKLTRNEARKFQRTDASVSTTGFSLRDRKLNFRAERDVRGMRAEEAIDIISRFIDDAVMVNAKEVKILHGKGNGILRHLIREYLATVPPVRSFRDEHEELGGAGITVVELDH